jgi:broad specificity phosphatase PhoE
MTKQVYVIRHAEWDLEHDRLTEEGNEAAQKAATRLPGFSVVYSSPADRAQQTAEIIGNQIPVTDPRAGTPLFPAVFRSQLDERRKTHPLGVAGALFELPRAQEVLSEAGKAFKLLVDKAMAELQDGEYGLIVSHDGTMVAAEKVLRGESFDSIEHSFGELEGFVIDDNKRITSI